MYSPDVYRNKNLIFVLFLLILIISSHLYYLLFAEYIGVWAIISMQTLCIVFWLYIARKWFLETRNTYINIIKESYTDASFINELADSEVPDIFSADLLEKIVRYQHSQEKMQLTLLETLKNNNMLLERNSRITDSIMEITSEILSSGEIDEVLQTILDKAIEIIPNAQKGSILLYNGSCLEFRAAHGYDFQVLKDLKFNIDQIFQYNSEDFYEPCIVSSPESYNKSHLEKDKFDMLRKGRGFELRSILSCAIQVDNEFYGIINLDNADDENAFSKDDKPLIKHLAVQIGIALKNARLIEKILYLSRHDSLTGIYNRCYWEEQLLNIHHKYNSSGSVYSLAIIDLNGLKQINDIYGHEAGDLMLKSLAQGINERLSKDDIFARYGGDEFTIIFADKGRALVEKTMKNINADFDKTPFIYCGRTVATISFAVGIAEFPTDASRPEELLKLADARMYRNKRRSKKPIL